MKKREIILDKLQKNHVIYRHCKSCVFSYVLAGGGRTVHKTRHSDNGNITETKIGLQSALKQLTDHFSDIVHY